MISRFQRLELESPPPPASPPPPDEPFDHAHWMRQAEQSRGRGRFEEALRNYSRAVESDRGTPSAWVGQVKMLIALAEIPEAELWARKALELFRGHPDLTASQAQSLGRMGETTQAQAVSDASIRLPGNSTYRWLARADVLLSRRQPTAEHCFNSAIALRDDWLIHLEIAEICLYRRRPARALASCQTALARSAGQAYGWFLLGQSQSACGMADAAQRSYAHALDIDPTDLIARQALDSPGRRSWLRRWLGRHA